MNLTVQRPSLEREVSSQSTFVARNSDAAAPGNLDNNHDGLVGCADVLASGGPSVTAVSHALRRRATRPSRAATTAWPCSSPS